MSKNNTPKVLTMRYHIHNGFQSKKLMLLKHIQMMPKYCKNHGEKMGAKNAESGRKAMLNDGPCSRSARREMGSDKHKENISAHSPGQSVCRLDCLGRY